MIHPSYTELIEAINNGAEEGDDDMVLNSRYSLVLATSKRARQLIAGAPPLVKGANGRKPLSVAIDELYKGKVKILPPREEDTPPVLEGISSGPSYTQNFFDEESGSWEDEGADLYADEEDMEERDDDYDEEESGGSYMDEDDQEDDEE